MGQGVYVTLPYIFANAVTFVFKYPLFFIGHSFANHCRNSTRLEIIIGNSIRAIKVIGGSGKLSSFYCSNHNFILGGPVCSSCKSDVHARFDALGVNIHGERCYCLTGQCGSWTIRGVFRGGQFLESVGLTEKIQCSQIFGNTTFSVLITRYLWDWIDLPEQHYVLVCALLVIEEPQDYRPTFRWWLSGRR